MNRKTLIGGVIVVVFIGLLVSAFLLGSKEKAKIGVGKERIAVIFIEGVITGDSGGTPFGQSTAGSYRIMDQLRQAREDASVKAVLLRLNTPGGSAPASEEIATEVAKLKEAGKIVVASMGDSAASGGYWIASYADKIVANPSSLTGSIGVIMSWQNWEELYKKIGIDPEVIKSGPYKDIGSNSREMTAAEKEILQAMIDEMYENFVRVVADGRQLSVERVRELADGRVYTGKQAKELGLVDELGNYYDALDITARLAGIKGKPEIVQYGTKTPWEYLFTGFFSRLSLPTNFAEQPLSLSR